jgi:hypothetical protein
MTSCRCKSRPCRAIALAWAPIANAKTCRPSAAGFRRPPASWRSRCPLHDERTPSFVVTPGRGWRCFGACDAGGDVIDLVQRLDGVGFREAVRRLAVRTGVYLADD